MNETLSRIEHTHLHFWNKPSIRNTNIEGIYELCKYTIRIPLQLNSSRRPEFNSLTIETLHNGFRKQAVIFDKTKVFEKAEGYYPDRKHIGEFIFLLAARFKFDLLNDMESDNSGFLHTDEIKKLKANKITEVGPQIYRGINNPSNLSTFTNKFLFEPNQLSHLICYFGYGGTDNKDIDLMFWLNVLPEDIVFTVNQKPIQNDKLLPHLKKLFPTRYLFSKSNKKQFVKNYVDSDVAAPKKQPETFMQPVAKLTDDPRIEQFPKQLCDQAKKDNATPHFDPLNLQLRTLDIDETNNNQNLFRFQYRWPEFVGRGKEMERLLKFVNFKGKNLLWWAITGSGGTGKSRLALELCCQLKDDGWDAGFLTNTTSLDILRNWRPPQPTLIVIDYDHEKAKEFGELVGGQYEESKSWKFPVRILFLQRQEESKALSQFCYPNNEVIENIIQYHEVGNDEKTLQLKGVKEEHVDAMITGVFERYPDKQPTDDKKYAIKNLLKEHDYANRPLYVMFIADACARGENIKGEGWDIGKLHKVVLEHSKKIWKNAGIDETNKIDKKHINLLILATMTGGVDITSKGYDKCLDEKHGRLNALDILPAEHECYDSKYKILSDNKKQGSPLVPDILGEYFVLQKWKGNHADVCRMELLTKIAWQNKPDETGSFLFRLMLDFSRDSKFKEVLDFVFMNKGHHMSRAALLYNLITFYSCSREFKNAIYYYRSLEKLWKSGYQKDSNFSLRLAEALVNLAYNYGKDGKFDEAIYYYNRLEELWQDGYQKDREISLRLAMLLSNLISDYGNADKLDQAIMHYNRLEKLWKSGYQRDEELSSKLARALLGLSADCGKAKLEQAFFYCNRLEGLWNTYKKSNRISSYLGGALSNLILFCTEAKKIERGVSCYNRLEELWKSGYQKDREITEYLMMALLNLIDNYGEGKFNIAVGYYNRLEELWKNSYQKDKDVSFKFVRISARLIYCLGKAGKLDKAVSCYTRLSELWENGGQQNKIISLELCKILMYLTYFFSEAGKFGAAEHHYNHLEKLWKNYHKNKEILLYLMEARIALIYYSCKLKNLDQASAYYTCLEVLWKDGYQQDTDAVLKLCRGLVNLIEAYGESSKFDKIEYYYKRLENLWKKGNQRNKDIALMLTNVLVNLILVYDKRLGQAIKCYSRLEALWSEGYQNDKDILSNKAGALVNLVSLCCKMKKFDKAKYYCGQMKNLCMNIDDKDEIISLRLAMAIYTLIINYSKSGDFNNAIYYYKHLENLCKNRHKKANDFSLRLAEALVNLTSDYGKAGKFDKAKHYYNRLEELWQDGYQKDKEISLRFAMVLSNLTDCYCEESKFDEAKYYYYRLEELWKNDYQKDKDISLKLADALVHLVLGYCNTKKFNIAVGYYNRLEELWQDGYQKDKEIILDVAMALVNLINYYGQAKKINKANYYYNIIRDLWNKGYQKDTELSFYFIKATHALLGSYGESGNFEKAVYYYDCLEEFWKSEYQKNKKISLSLADATVDIVYYCAENQENDRVANYYIRLENLCKRYYRHDMEITFSLARVAGNCLSMFKARDIKKAKHYKNKAVELCNLFPECKEMVDLSNSCEKYFQS